MTAIPSENPIRAMLDGVFSTILKDIDRSDGLAPFRYFYMFELISVDGYKYCRSHNIFFK